MTPRTVPVARIATHIAEHCLGMRARRLGRELARLYDAELAPLGLTGAQLSLLVALQCLGETQSSSLAKELGLEKSTVSRNLRLMEEADWITIASVGRRHHISITPSGTQILLKSEEPWKRAQEKARLQLGKENASLLYSLYSNRS